MTKDELYGVARALLAAAGGFAVSRGWVDSETAMELAGAVATSVAIAWSIMSKRR